MAFQRHEDWVEERPPDFGLCRNFFVWCASCGSHRVKASVGYDSGDFEVLLVCQQCRLVAVVEMRKPVPKPFKAVCCCKSVFVCPVGDAESGRFSFTCLDCLKTEDVPTS